jgi:site-specific DNA recombinase
VATKRKALKVDNRTAIYCRVSTDQQATEGLSLDAQQERLLAYCTARGLDVVDVVVDAGESAGKPLAARPGGRKLLGLVKRKAVGSIVVLKLDRAFRNAKDCLNVVDDWDRLGVALHIVDMGGQSIDTQSAMGRMFLVMAAGFAEMERRLTMERTVAALAHKARTGNMRTNSTAPFGWKYEGNALAELPDEQLVIGLVRVMRQTGVSFRAACAELTARGHRNRSGGEFAPVQLERMLRGSVRQMHAAAE